MISFQQMIELMEVSLEDLGWPSKPSKEEEEDFRRRILARKRKRQGKSGEFPRFKKQGIFGIKRR